jgi:hypothetical protein
MEGVALSNPHAIGLYRLTVLKSALRLEMMGMTRRGRSTYAIVKEEFGFRGSKRKVLDRLSDYLEKAREGVVAVDEKGHIA